MSMTFSHAQDKLAFLLSFVPYLIDKGQVRVTDAAAHFGVSAEFIRSSVTMLTVSGVPGNAANYGPNDLFDIDWDLFEDRDEIVLTHQVALDDSPRFSAREAAALIAGLQYLSALPENTNHEALGALLGKLSRGASAPPSQLGIATVPENVALATIRGAVARNRQIEFGYLNARGEHETRRVDPLRIESIDHDWYLRGWCHLREAVRTFRIDRMSALHQVDEAIGHHAGEVSLPESLFQSGAEDLCVVLELPASVVPLLRDYLADTETSPVGSGRVRATLRASHFHGLKRLIASFGSLVTVVEPASARAVVAEWARAGAAQYEASA